MSEVQIEPSVTIPKLKRSLSLSFERNAYISREQETWKHQTHYLSYLEKEIISEMYSKLEKAKKKKTSQITYFSIAPGVYLKTELYFGESTLGNQVMKLDHFGSVPKLANSPNKPPELDIPDDMSAPNFRRIPQCPYIYGVGQPTLEGIHLIIKEFYLKLKPECIIWINLREEPLVYVNGNPYSPRDPDTLNINLEYLLGIQGVELESLELQLQADILRKSVVYLKGMFEYYYQDNQMKNEIRKEPIQRDSIKCVHEVYADIRETYPVQYYRIPITDETEPEMQDFNYFTDVFRENLHSRNIFVFNCQMGRGRTTTGMVCAFLYDMRKKSWLEKPNGIEDEKEEIFNPDFDESNLSPEKGEFPLIVKLVSSIEHGFKYKKEVDYAIDCCGEFINLRSSIADVFRQLEKETNPQTREILRSKFRNYLERYWWLIVYNYYLNVQGPNGEKFSSWMKNNWRLKHMLKKF